MVTARKNYPDPLPNPREMRETLKLSRERMGRLLDVSSKTIERWEQRNFIPRDRALIDRLTKIQEIVKLGLTIYTPEGFQQFMTTPLSDLDGRTALQTIEIGQADRVLSVLAADYEGLGY